ncbi:hypothetical protein FQA47_008009 [Oryzias melastigma]|uniref:Uncharacterized protein n=1 Tax=Oryzias melastigma TaxID=30732 RepID=A0A834CJK5_ORYME|nr:hypothetical protein FQA47_008009 [Oryzias melastigma]
MFRCVTSCISNQDAASCGVTLRFCHWLNRSLPCCDWLSGSPAGCDWLRRLSFHLPLPMLSAADPLTQIPESEATLGESNPRRFPAVLDPQSADGKSAPPPRAQPEGDTGPTG